MEGERERLIDTITGSRTLLSKTHCTICFCFLFQCKVKSYASYTFALRRFCSCHFLYLKFQQSSFYNKIPVAGDFTKKSRLIWLPVLKAGSPNPTLQSLPRTHLVASLHGKVGICLRVCVKFFSNLIKSPVLNHGSCMT